MILTDTHSGAWNSSCNGTLAVRRYLLQNWRSDVVATTTDDGTPYEYVRYSPYGVPTSYPAADANRDMVTDATDENDWLTVFGGVSAPIVINIDTNKDDLFPDTGDFDFMADEAVSGKLGGYNKMGMAGAGPSLRFAYAGYAWDPAIKEYHVRHRVYSPEVGRWLSRDPLGYVDGTNHYAYTGAMPNNHTDPLGLFWGITPCSPWQADESHWDSASSVNCQYYIPPQSPCGDWCAPGTIPSVLEP